MDTRLIKTLPVIFLSLGLLVGCGDDDDDKAPTGQNGEAVDAQLSDEEQAAAVFEDLQESLAPIAALLLTGGTAQGEQGTATVAGPTLTFEEYSHDGALIVNGELAMALGLTSLSLKGTLDLSGSYEGEVEVNLTVGASDPPTYAGTVTVGGTAYDVEALSQQASG